MCMFCAAIPGTLAVGTAAHGRSKRLLRDALPGEQVSTPRIPPLPLTAVAVTFLVVCAFLYHTRLLGAAPLFG
jgi:hypothetical protein